MGDSEGSNHALFGCDTCQRVSLVFVNYTVMLMGANVARENHLFRMIIG